MTQKKDMTYIYVIQQATGIARSHGSDQDNPYPINNTLHDVWIKAFDLEIERLKFFAEDVDISDSIEWKREGF